MAALNFPSSPTALDEYTDPTGQLWIYNGTAWRKDTKVVSPMYPGPAILYVGTGGDFTTLRDAINYLSQFTRRGGTTSYSDTMVEVRINSGHVIEHQIVIDNGIDLSWVTITGVDTSTNVASTVWTNENAITRSWDGTADAIPIFLFDHLSTGPIISQLFVDPNEDIYEEYRFGVWCDNGSTVVITNGGMNNFDVGCFVVNQSVGTFYNSEFNSVDNCIFVDNNSSVIIEECNGACGGVCVELNDSSSARIAGCSFSDASFGIKLEGACTTYISGNFTDCDIGISIEAASKAYIRGTQVSGYGTNGVSNWASHVYIFESNLTENNNSTTASTNCKVDGGGITSIWDCTTGTNQTENNFTSNGIIFAQ